MAIASYELADLLRARDRLEEAAELFLRAKDLFVVLGDGFGQGSATNGLGLVALQNGRLHEAGVHFEQALSIFIELNDRHHVAAINNNLGLLEMRRERLLPAAEHFEIALSILQGPVDLRDIKPTVEPDVAMDGAAELTWALNTLNNLAIVRRKQGAVALAERYWRNLLALEGHVDRARTGAEARHNLAGLLIRQGRLDEALPILSRAMELFDADGARRWMSEVRVRLSQIYFHLGDIDAALHFAHEAVELKPEDLDARLRALRNLADLEQELADFPAAIAAIDNALALIADRPDSRQHLMLESRRAHVALLAGSPDRAIETQGAVRNAMAEFGQPGESAIVAYRLGVALIADGRHDEARRILHDALSVFRDTQRVFHELLTLDALLELPAGGDAARLETSTQAFDRALALRGQSLGNVRRLGMSATLGRIDERHIRLLVEMDRPEQAWESTARVRASETIDLRRAHRRGLKRSDRRRLLDRHGALMTQLHERRLVGAGDRDEPDEQELLLAIDRLETRLRQLEGRGPEGARTSLAAVRSRLEAHQLLLTFYLMEDRSFLWAISSERSRMFELPGSGRIEALVSDLLARLRHPRQAVGAIGRLAGELGGMLVEPASEMIARSDELLIEPHGNLQGLPFSLLVNDGTPLGKRLALRRIAAMDNALPASPASFGAKPRMMLVANPGWQSGGAPASSLPERSLARQLMRGGLLARLPGTQREAQLLGELDPAAVDVRIRTGRTASRQFLLAGGLGGYSLVHIATHGLVDLHYPELSALLLANENGPGPSLLRPMEIAELSLDAQLVVLSGCETGTGPVPAGGGALSLARPFMVAGARNVLSTLWKIDDARTAEFMQVFYRHLLIEAQSPAGALGAAQRHMRQHRETAHPYYWAGFVLTGTSLDD
ncbi:CHAT domain-containing tetratricopeptide repeat protein [Wenzhouxiangella sp. EGI_FJ10409]|uniref:CHAT domain-containing tetratricopeptide repeat protein n=1 Tax=Wenzhouxiangella sp. EGI_FJ10409 TaxID=3243767 RepID=UPI0035DAD2AB